MAAPVDPERGLARAFAEFWLLPDLLALPGSGDGPPAAWADLLSEHGYNMDHVFDEDLPPGPDVASVMAQDAWRIADWLELIDADGLTVPGRGIAAVAEVASRSRTEAVWEPAEGILAAQISRHYAGARDLSIVELVQLGARALAVAQDEWTSFCPGLLHVEFEALVYLAQTNPERAVELAGELAQNRIEAMRGAGQPVAGVVDLLNMTIHADAVSSYYLDQLDNHVDDAILTLTASQATVLLFVFCGLLECPLPWSPVQYLTAPSA